ncbi:MAG: transcriptional repressor LexA [Candidatus Aegiribacteria sp.]|nr:transcriptional repressor LexA [Candidatus Aegiribacteria sp.]
MRRITDRQKQVLDYICDFIDEHSYAPSIRDIQKHFGLKSTKGVKDHIDRLVEKGYLNRTEGTARALRVVRDGKKAIKKIPLVGTVAAGLPILAEENIEDYLPVSADMARIKGMFFLRVNGDSMINAAIMDGDLVLVRPQPFVEQGEIAVVRIGDEATVKRFFRFKTRVELRSENPNHKPIVYRDEDEDVRIVGKVTAVLRILE